MSESTKSPSSSGRKRPMETGHTGKVIITVVIYIAAVSLGATPSSIGPTLLDIQRQTSATTRQAAMLVTCLSVGRLPGIAAMAFALESWNQHLTVGCVFLIYALCGVTFCTVPHYGVVAVAITIYGAAHGFLNGAMNLFIFNMWDAPAFFLGLHLCLGLGTVLGPMLVTLALHDGYLHNGLGKVLPMSVMTHNQSDSTTQSLGFDNSTLSMTETPDGVWLHSTVNNENYRYPFIGISTIAIIVAISFLVSGCMKNVTEEGEEDLLLKQKTVQIKSTIQGRGATVYFLGLFIVMLFFQGGTEVAYSGLLMMYTTIGLQMSELDGDLLNELYWGGILLFRVLAIPLSYFVNFKVQIPISLTLALISMAVMCFAVTAHPVVIWVSTAGFGLACSVMIQNLLLLINEHITFSSRIASLSIAPLFLGSTVLSAITGNVMATFGMHTFPSLFFSYVCLSCIFYIIYHFSKPMFKTIDASLQDHPKE